MRHHDDHDRGTTGGDTMTKKTTNGHHVNGRTNGRPALRPATSVSWLPASALPDDLTTVPDAEPVDEAPIWGGQMPDPAALAAAVERAKETVVLQSDEALTLAKSPADLAKDLEVERRLRDLDRDRRLRREQARIAEAEAVDAHEQRMRDLDRKARESSAHATVTADALTNPHHEVVRLHRARRWVPALAAVPGVFALVAGAINVGSQLDRLFPGVPFVSWVIDPIITLAIIAIGAAHLYDVVRPRNTGDGARAVNPFKRVEVFLFVLTSTAAVALHYPDGPGPERAGADGITPLIWLSIPVGLGVSLWLVPKLRTVFTDRLREAREEARRYDAERAGRDGAGEGFPTGSDLHGENAGEPFGETVRESHGETVPAPVPAAASTPQAHATATVPEPAREGLDSIRARLRTLAEAGALDPQTVSVNAAREALGVRPERAEEALIAEYGRLDLVERRRRREAKRKGGK